MNEFVKEVRVYRNLRKRCYSVQWHGKVIAHVDSIRLKNVRFQVSEAGRQRVINTARKNVHAYIIGNVSMDQPLDKGMQVKYNPYVSPYFRDEAGRNIHDAKDVSLTPNGVFIRHGASA